MNKFQKIFSALDGHYFLVVYEEQVETELLGKLQGDIYLNGIFMNVKGILKTVYFHKIKEVKVKGIDFLSPKIFFEENIKFDGWTTKIVQIIKRDFGQEYEIMTRNSFFHKGGNKKTKSQKGDFEMAVFDFLKKDSEHVSLVLPLALIDRLFLLAIYNKYFVLLDKKFRLLLYHKDEKVNNLISLLKEFNQQAKNHKSKSLRDLADLL